MFSQAEKSVPQALLRAGRLPLYVPCCDGRRTLSYVEACPENTRTRRNAWNASRDTLLTGAPENTHSLQTRYVRGGGTTCATIIGTDRIQYWPPQIVPQTRIVHIKHNVMVVASILRGRSVNDDDAYLPEQCSSARLPISPAHRDTRCPPKLAESADRETCACASRAQSGSGQLDAAIRAASVMLTPMPGPGSRASDSTSHS